MKYLFILLMIFAVWGGAIEANAQAGRTLVSSKQPLRQADVDTLIEFYEWAFEGAFTGEQRDELTRQTVAEYKAKPAESRRTLDDIIQTFAKIKLADDDVQRATREAFLAEFLPEARKNDDENSRLLLSVYEAAHGGAGAETPIAARDEQAAQDERVSHGTGNGTLDLSSLAGEWVWGSSGSITRTTAGAYLGGSGSRHTYKFAANGSVEYTGIMNQMAGGCRMQIFRSAKGRATLSGSTLTIKWAPASFSRDDSCSPAKNYKKSLPAETDTFQVKFQMVPGQKQLCLISTDEMCFSPA